MIVKKSIVYLGMDGRPSNPAQVRLEISGLKHAVTIAKEMIARLEQSMAIMDLKREEMLDGKAQEKGADTKVDSETEKTD
jgi:hypothetical protein